MVDTMPVGQQTQAQQQVGRFAHTPESYAAMERNAGIQKAQELRLAGHPGRAHYELQRSFLRQVRILGLSYAGIPGRPYEAGGPLP